MHFDTEKELAALRETEAASENIFDGLILHVKKDLVDLPNGEQAYREIIRHIGAVCVIPVTEEGEVIVERQYRYPIARVTTEIPAGKLDSREEDRLDAIKRELREETGLSAEEWTYLGDYYGAPAYSDERISMYMARKLHAGHQDLDADEFLDVHRIPLKELVEQVMDGTIQDAKTQVAVLKAARILGV
ncbi:MAG: NUDIX hydrolase [Clostridia bacterium]|nr:NUDIX hydrolase [Clostridia bacterium]